MASMQSHKGRWRVQVYVGGKRRSKVCATRQQAAAWALAMESELGGATLPDKTLTDALRRYANEVSPTHRGERTELLKLRAWEKLPFAQLKLAGLEASDFAGWRDARLRKVKPGTVAREMNLMRSMLETCRREWGWIKTNPMADVRRPAQPKGRARRISADEVEAVARDFDVFDKLNTQTQRQRVGLAFLFALETAMRAGEIVGLRRGDIDLENRVATLRLTKNGDSREVPLSTRAVEILDALHPWGDTVFGLTADKRSAIWRYYCMVRDLRFHDARAEAIWRLSKKLDILQLARMIGHRDPRSLMIYYRESAAEMAKRLD